jgi:hypothetical protein
MRSGFAGRNGQLGDAPRRRLLALVVARFGVVGPTRACLVAWRHAKGCFSIEIDYLPSLAASIFNM